MFDGAVNPVKIKKHQNLGLASFYVSLFNSNRCHMNSECINDEFVKLPDISVETTGNCTYKANIIPHCVCVNSCVQFASATTLV